jgi:hypothetical protein
LQRQVFIFGFGWNWLSALKEVQRLHLQLKARMIPKKLKSPVSWRHRRLPLYQFGYNTRPLEFSDVGSQVMSKFCDGSHGVWLFYLEKFMVHDGVAPEDMSLCVL